MVVFECKMLTSLRTYLNLRWSVLPLAGVLGSNLAEKLFRPAHLSLRHNSTTVETNKPSPLSNLFPNEPSSPHMITSLPGPNAQNALKSLDRYQDVRAAQIAMDMEKSVGNYIVDADGNTLLDVLCQIASLAIGYNNSVLMAAGRSEAWTRYIINRPALGICPPKDFGQLLEDSLMKVAPPGLSQVFTAMCGSCANETAFKAAHMLHQQKKRGSASIPFTDEELTSCLSNKPPGSPELCVLSFASAFHGRMASTLSTTRSKALHKVDFPAFEWPAAPFPRLQYPLDQFSDYNRAEEDMCLAETERLIVEWKRPVSAAIVEPIQAEGGDNHASPEFFRKLQALLKKHDVTFIVDEVQTGVGATGKMWAHEHWGLPEPPDIVTFAKKMQAAGFYHNSCFRPNLPYRNFNTWMGDPVRLLYAQTLIKEIDRCGLLENVREVGSYLLEGIKGISGRLPPGIILNPRGLGFIIAFDCASPVCRETLITGMRQAGVQISGCGDRTVRLRPMLVFQ
eukprot:Ihof_evm1s834 gene=Ihof_evmTU1s834